MRFDFAQSLRPDELEAGHAVGGRALVERGQRPELRVGEGNDELAGVLERDALLAAIRFEGRLALAAEPRLQGTRRVVEPGMDDAAVMARLVRRQLGFALEDDEPQARPVLQQPPRRREPHDSATDDDDIDGGAVARRRRHRTGVTRGNGTPRRSPSSTSDAWWRASMATPRSADRRSASASGSPGMRTRPGASGIVSADVS